jgi:hypothetical protein
MEQDLKKMFGLARGFTLPAADALKLLDDFGEFSSIKKVLGIFQFYEATFIEHLRTRFE